MCNELAASCQRLCIWFAAFTGASNAQRLNDAHHSYRSPEWSQYDIPVNFVRDSGDLLILSRRERTWWRNVRGCAPVVIRLPGYDLSGEAVVIEDAALLREPLLSVLRQAPWYQRATGVTLGPDGEPEDAEMFGGKFDPSTLNLPHKILTALPASPLHGLPSTDLRDWTAIRAWAARLAVELGHTVPHETAT